MSFLRPIALAIVALCMSTGLVNATELLSETFNYPDGSLVGNGTWTNHSGTMGDLLVSGGQAVVQHGTPSEDANVLFASVASGIVTANFDMVVNDDTAITGSDDEYFAHFREDASFNFVTRLDIGAANTMGNDYTLGISNSSSAEATLAQDFMYGDLINVTIGFDFGTGLSFLTVGAETISGTTSSAQLFLDSFALRQSDSGNNESITVDNLTVSASKIPEPTTAAILGLGLVAGMVRRRR